MSLDDLTRISAQDMLEAFGLGRVRRGRGMLEAACLPAARQFARQIAAFDDRVAAAGLREGAAWVLRQNISRLEAAGLEHIPADGPLLLVSNHPGLTDAMALLATLPRGDLRIVAADRPFLRALPFTSRHLIYLRPAESGRTAVLREVASHLRRGGAVLIFPGGQIEPDPALSMDALRSLAGWSKSVGVIVRLSRGIKVVPAIVSGVVSRPAQNSLLTRMRRKGDGRARLAAMLQILVASYRAVNVRVAFGPALGAEELLASGDDTETITGMVIERTRRLIEAPPTDWRVVLDSQALSPSRGRTV